MAKDEEAGAEEIVSLMTEATEANASTSPRRRRPVEHVRMRREGAPSNSLMRRLTCLSVLTLVVVSSMGLLTYLQDEKAPKYQLIPSEEDEGSEELLWEAMPDRIASPNGVDQSALNKLLQDLDMVDSTKRQAHTVRYAPQWNQHNPFDFQATDVRPNPLAPLLPTSKDDTTSFGYLKMPHLVKNQLVFCSQGNAYLTTIQESGPMPAIKLTTAVGNVLDPRLHPNLRYLAYTATYAKRRDIYLLDLQGGSPAVRLTYWDTAAGVDGLIGWWGESSLVFRALSNQVSLPDYRLYVLHLEDMGTLNTTNHRIEQLEDINTITEKDDTDRQAMFQIDSIPLSQARDAARYKDCWYFVRTAQTSHTIRYVGGTAEQLYRYCDGANSTERLFYQDGYNGTSKSPQIYPEYNFLFFLSDRAPQPGGTWTPDRMNVWAMPLFDKNRHHTFDKFVQITDTACDFEGRVIQEYSFDSETGNMVVRVGADLYWMTADAIQERLQTVRRLRDVDENATQVDDLDQSDTLSNATDSKIYYKYEKPLLESSRLAQDQSDHVTGTSTQLTRLPIVVHSDFHTLQERIIPVSILKHMTSADVYSTAVGSLQFVMTLRGQLWVAPVEHDSLEVYRGAGRNMPERRYRVAPGSTMGGIVRILAVRHVPNPVEDQTSDRRLAVILATDPLTQTAEHAFYLIETQSSATPLFVDKEHLPKPFLGGSVSGGSTKDGGLGSVEPDSISVSPCGRRMAWSDRDGRIVLMNLPQYQDMTNRNFAESVVLPKENEIGQPMVGQDAILSWSPGGRYLAIQHTARNQFQIISIADLGDPQGVNMVADIQVGRIVQATPDRFNSESPYWGKSTADMFAFDREEKIASLLGTESPADVATTLYFLSDRDISSDVRSPWGTRQPMPHFKKLKSLFALPLYPTNTTNKPEGPFSGGGASEIKVDDILALKKSLKAVLKASGKKGRKLLEASLAGAFDLANDFFLERTTNDIARRLAHKEQEGTAESNSTNSDDDTLRTASFPEDMDIDFGPVNDRSFTFARHAYRLATIPEANYVDIVSQTLDDGSFVLIKLDEDKPSLVVYIADDFPSDQYTAKVFSPTARRLGMYGRSTSRDRLFFAFAPDGYIRVVSNTGSAIAKMLVDTELDDNVVSTSGLALSVWPSLEYRHLYDDAWRMLRDYFYDPDMTGIDWPAIHQRYLPLVARCSKREELDDVLAQMASELSALHVFVYGGEYDSPLDGVGPISMANDLASLGASFRRAPEWKGYVITSIAESDPDFSLLDGHTEIYSPLSDKTLRLSGQRGLKVGDVIVGINGESVMKVPDVHMLLRGMAGNSVKLDVLRLASKEPTDRDTGAEVPVEAVIVVPIKTAEADMLRYHAWEWKTRLLAEKLAEDNGFSVGYVHLQDMSGPEAEDAFARGFFPNYNKQAMILDVRHNRGGNIDSWVLDVLQRKAWMYWQSRDYTVENGGIGWDEQFAFRGHIVVLLDEKTASDGEGVSRGISELGLGRLIGTRTWGGGIWLSSDNHLVDGGIASAPEIGTYNDNFGWGLGIEQMGVNPDIEVDNDPFQAFGGKDSQLEAAIVELKRWLSEEPVVLPKPPERKRDMTMGERECRS